MRTGRHACVPRQSRTVVWIALKQLVGAVLVVHPVARLNVRLREDSPEVRPEHVRLWQPHVGARGHSVPVKRGERHLVEVHQTQPAHARAQQHVCRVRAHTAYANHNYQRAADARLPVLAEELGNQRVVKVQPAGPAPRRLTLVRIKATLLVRVAF